MAQLKVKQISDFVTAVATVHNGTAGTQTTTDIAAAKSQAISQAVVNGDIAYDVKNAASTALVSAVSADVVVKSQAISAAVLADITVASNASTATSNALVSAVSQAEAKDVSRASAAATALSTAIATEVSDRNTAIGVVNTKVTTLLGGSTEALDTFGEIKGFIDGLAAADVTTITAISTAVSNDVIHSAGISANTSAIAGFGDIVSRNAEDFATAAQGVKADSALQNAAAFDAAGSADTAEANAIAHADGLAGNYDVKGDAAAALTAAKLYADTAESDAISTASGDATSKANAAQAAAISTASGDATSKANTALSSANGYTDGREISILSVLRSEISAVAGTDKIEQVSVEILPLTHQFRIVTPISSDNMDIMVFINGLQIHAQADGFNEGYDFDTADGVTFNVDYRGDGTSTLGYDLETNDHIVVVGVAR